MILIGIKSGTEKATFLGEKGQLSIDICRQLAAENTRALTPLITGTDYVRFF